jgi:hypothetical protein
MVQDGGMNHQSFFAGRGLRRRGKESFWRDVFKQFACSGQSIRRFCAQRGLSEPSFYVWRRTLARRDVISPPTVRHSAAPAFLPIQLAGQQSGRIEIVLGGGRRVRLSGPVDRATLADVLSTLESLRPGVEPC